MNPVSGTTYLQNIPKDLRRGFPIKAAMWPFGIIELSVFFYHLLCLEKIFKEISIKTLISELAVEAFNIAVLPGTALFDKFMAYAVLLQKLLKSSTSEFRPLIASDDPRCAKDQDAFLQNFHNPSCGNAELTVNARRKSAEEILYGHEFNAPAVCKGIKEEIYGPDMISISGFGQRQLNYSELLIFARSVSLQIKASVDSVELLVIDMNTSLVNNIENPSIAVKGVFKSYLTNHLSHFIVLLRLQRVVIQGTERNAQEKTHPFNFDSMPYHFFSYYSPFIKGQKFFLTMSLRTCISSSFSARILLSLRFSSSRTFSLFASLDESPLNFCFHLSNVLRPIEYLRQISATELPGRFASASICIIFTTGYFVGFISCTPFLNYTLLYILTFVVPKNGVQVIHSELEYLSPEEFETIYEEERIKKAV